MKWMPWLRIQRPAQWLKNLMVFFPPFLSGAMAHNDFFWRGLLPFVAFCCASSAGYVFNDLVDRRRDAAHPKKKSRPIPSGQVGIPSALSVCLGLTGLACITGLAVSKGFLLFTLAYLLSAACYSLLLKEVAVLDIFGISLGFVLRLYGGGQAFHVDISDWLFLTVFLLSIFLSVGKRYSEMRLLGDDAGIHRRTLEEYPRGFLEGAMYLSGAAVLVTYALYAIGHPPMVYSVPLCMFGLLRYLMRIKVGGSGDPTESLLKDFPLFVTGLLWTVFVWWSVYL
jgi:4-hydroxybenzoate polyprenyltransferase